MAQLQRTSDWFKDRAGNATGSRFNDIMAGARLAGWRNYKAQLVLEQITGNVLETYQNAAMAWGTDFEPVARTYYTLTTGNDVEEVGFIKHDILPAGVSPDGLVGQDGLVEFKAPFSSTHLETLHTQKVPKMYYAQVQGQMWITERSWCDFVSFDPRMPENARIVIIRVERDDEYIAELEQTIARFMDEVDQEVQFVKAYGGAEK